ncbi:hypothetical protein OY671_008559, partial [Metschnikowia pulcherrima]
AAGRHQAPQHGDSVAADKADRSARIHRDPRGLADLEHAADGRASGGVHNCSASAGSAPVGGSGPLSRRMRQAGIAKARVLASVSPDDAANVFITLSARNLNARIEIIARGEAPSTESKSFHAGADKVVSPTHIGAERITESILYPATGKAVGSDGAVSDMKRGLHDLGLESEVVTAIKHGASTGSNVREAERQGNGAFFIVQIDRANGQSTAHPGDEVRIEPGDSVMSVVRGSRLS